MDGDFSICCQTPPLWRFFSCYVACAVPFARLFGGCCAQCWSYCRAACTLLASTPQHRQCAVLLLRSLPLLVHLNTERSNTTKTSCVRERASGRSAWCVALCWLAFMPGGLHCKHTPLVASSWAAAPAVGHLAGRQATATSSSPLPSATPSSCTEASTFPSAR